MSARRLSSALPSGLTSWEWTGWWEVLAHYNNILRITSVLIPVG